MPLPTESPPIGASPDATKGEDDGLSMSELLSLYMQQNGALNQLWAMFAATTFAAGVFAFSVGGTANSKWMLIPGAIGFLFFATGHGVMVWHAVQRLNLVASDILAKLEAKAGARGSPSVVWALARRRASLRGAMVAHIGIDICVLAAFAMRLDLHVFGWRLSGLS